MRTQIQQIDFGTVRISYDSLFGGERITREFDVPVCGGTVRERDRTVCKGLAVNCGAALSTVPEGLIDVIRTEYRRMRQQEAAFLRG